MKHSSNARRAVLGPGLVAMTGAGRHGKTRKAERAAAKRQLRKGHD